MQAITVSDREAGVAGLSLTELPYPVVSENDVVVRVHAAGFTPGELDWPDTWTDRSGRGRSPRRIRPHQTHPRQNNPARHPRLKTEPPVIGPRIASGILAATASELADSD